MIKDPNSLYINKRSDKLLKIKMFQDAEARVTGHEKGTGRCSGMLGALKVYDDKLGVSFKVGSGFDDKGRRSPPKIGSIITYKY